MRDDLDKRLADVGELIKSQREVARMSVRRLAELAGVSIGSLYQYFPNRDALTAALIERETAGLLEAAVNDVPDVWLADEPGFSSPDAVREAYVEQLAARLAARDIWLPGLRALREVAS